MLSVSFLLPVLSIQSLPRIYYFTLTSFTEFNSWCIIFWEALVQWIIWGITLYSRFWDTRDVPLMVDNVRCEVEALQPILISLKDYLDNGCALPNLLRRSLSDNLQNLKYVEAQVLSALEPYLHLPAGRLAKLRLLDDWNSSTGEEVDKLRSHLAAHKATLLLILMITQQYVHVQSLFLSKSPHSNVFSNEMKREPRRGRRSMPPSWRLENQLVVIDGPSETSDRSGN